ncbi:DUF4219 domain-containing protein/UBN2 domain-containing protein [Cucumis melo var. makuwa]|uniref:DUF4219 domain-containing protein/UBN2 domain-containing protein n=1 Tax=Cucumis melo var. makuwa TaxID=1194695 RepID=A0A5D3BT94_CUCMM|nr:DUF4219 domain-containing protein/UBN2 domain-containing protein [Cucumis melo var. makuwa]TYK02340.1 DUF4219 domain-containing protein/UBN2 domain-containing protein [Cucumis melo var. makuwa]
MKIIKEEDSSTSRPPVLDGKNYSYWKPRMTLFLKTLDGRAWRVVVARREPLMITVDEDETVAYYNARVLGIANESFNPGEKIPDSKIVHKVLHSLPEKFDMKVTTIEEAHDIITLKLDELFGSLLTFEMTISNRENKKGKGFAFKSISEEESTNNKSSSEANLNE